MKRIIMMSFFGLMLYACNNGQTDKSTDDANKIDMNDRGNEKFLLPEEILLNMILIGEPEKFTHVDVGNKLDVVMAAGGEKYME